MADHGGGRVQHLQPRSSAEHGSLHGLTLNEVQSHLGKPLHGLRFSDLLKRAQAADGLRCSGSSGVGVPRALGKKTIVERVGTSSCGTRRGSCALPTEEQFVGCCTDRAAAFTTTEEGSDGGRGREDGIERRQKRMLKNRSRLLDLEKEASKATPIPLSSSSIS
ncbi:hypothetical protein BHM03_00029287 [Ensete ventricosum]|nr:hypothetical protein BHM03_00029287 [Ensete ventricosum]